MPTLTLGLDDLLATLPITGVVSFITDCRRVARLGAIRWELRGRE
jgi:hypothetical protein